MFWNSEVFKLRLLQIGPELASVQKSLKRLNVGSIRIGCSRKEIEIRIREGNPPEKNLDNGLEFCEGEFREFCKNDEIFRHLTVRKIPQQNGVAEHMNRTLLERACCMFSNAGLPREFLLAKAFSTAYYLVNRSPHSSLEFKTPEEAFKALSRLQEKHLLIPFPYDSNRKELCLLRLFGSLEQGSSAVFDFRFGQYRISVPYLDAYSSICSPVTARIRERLFFLFLLLVLFLNGIIATRGKAILPTLPQKGAALFPPKMPVPLSGPNKQHNSVPRLRILATVVYGSKRLVPSGPNPLHN
ncbi:hypothetical protein BUALT_Bualt15G0138900 [Buddleja alternifolia]|uniref:Integrase catalytic domain-containing protein n=1 Tax=Buddleja alternifolia TaxID=168488 RepID=A0AAV6WN90_9LAMI|nr:hypothetical protein BUALT_Bualt15G0138900 [Buddleja alternifolia]